jgi:hypothetical protein
LQSKFRDPNERRRFWLILFFRNLIDFVASQNANLQRASVGSRTEMTAPFWTATGKTGLSAIKPKTAKDRLPSGSSNPRNRSDVVFSSHVHFGEIHGMRSDSRIAARRRSSPGEAASSQSPFL